ncbi:ABC transporter substrate-binding protein [Bacillus sp. AFS041924]|uniref:ABC transporter substrate-binding protein n=1 Tax=Bacillus sp. AFS041924 TaxID=2033503 RepID=UPI000BFD1436|nr:extracellular solute-binding protein [Bacillus sp. AFS041924]PGS53867.1 ABC transporter substrate-binding protein [Bacillus sp. AFS041924]
MKRILSLMMSLFVLFSLVACSSGKTPSDKNNNSEQNHANNSNNNANREDLSLKLSKDVKKTITISVLGKHPDFVLAAKEYEKKHPNITIELKSFASGGGGISLLQLEKYVAQTTTEVLSGKGADLFILNDQSLPIDRYIDKNAFVDLNHYIEKDTSFDKSQYYMNILDHSKINGGLYLMPTRFSLGALIANQEAISKTGIQIDDQQNWTWDRFTEISQQLKTKGTLDTVMEVTPEGILNPLVFSDENYDKLVDIEKKEAQFDSPLFIDLLKKVKKMYDDDVLSDYQLGVQKTTYFTSSPIYSANDFAMRSAIYYQNGATIYDFPHSSKNESGVTFTGYDRYAMNTNSTVKMEAWDYLKFLLSYEIQTQSVSGMFPVNIAANEKEFTDVIEGKVENGDGGKVGKGGKGGVVTVSEASLEPLKQMISEANTQVRWNEKIRIIIEEESKSFFKGQKSSESVAMIIQNRVTTYLNE